MRILLIGNRLLIFLNRFKKRSNKNLWAFL